MYLTTLEGLTKAANAGNYISWLRKLRPIVAETDHNCLDGPGPEVEQLTVDDVRFVYPARPNTMVLRGISIECQPGSFIALVGGSGCGKSTMIAMFERFYDPMSGMVRLGAENISSLNPRLYRQQIALVQQEPTLYQGTIRENIKLGLEEPDSISEELVLNACRQANIYEFVASLPAGLDTYCGSKGLSLSGGQRQRIAIARALIRDPKFLLLDEATSALDTESERLVQEALTGAMRGKRTTIAVAHRLSTVKKADQIFVLFQGRVAECGNHAELIQEGGLYFQMCKAQSLN